MITQLIVLAIIIALIGVFILQGYKKIPANPPHVGQLTKFGKRIPGKYFEEGWHFLPLYPYWYGLILVNMEKKTAKITVKSRTPDRAESEITISIVFRPLSNLLSNYLNSGQEQGVITQLLSKILERVREWAMNLEEGPTNWEELMQSKLESISVLVTKLARNSLTEIPDFAQDVPTWIWLRFFSKPRPKKFLKNEDEWAKDDWKKVKEYIEVIRTQHGNEAVIKLEESVSNRRKEIEDLRTGNGKIILDDLGIILERLNVEEIEVLGDVAKHADQEAKEKMEREAEALEVKNILDRVKELMGSPFNFSAEHALENILVNMGKIPKTITEKKFNISAETLKTLQETLSPTLQNILQIFSKKGGNE